MKVLIAEDDPVSRLILQRAVEKAGHECVVAQDGLEAWQLSQAMQVDTIISDWMMPGIDGVELCRRVRADPRSGYTYFIFLTALGDKSHLLTGIQAGADDYLRKPLDRDELAVRLIAAERVSLLHQQLTAQRAELQRLNRNLFTQARTDALTQVANRLQLHEDLEVLRGRTARYGHCYAAIMCDIDYFKVYNDAHGHGAGDQVLATIAGILVQACRQGDQVYRYGGEEFLIILPEASVERAMLAAERLRNAVEGLQIPYATPTRPGVVTLSLGVAVMIEAGVASVEALLRTADAALYRAKDLGRNRVAVPEVGLQS